MNDAMVDLPNRLIKWYSIDSKLQTQNHEVITFEQSIAILDEYFANLKREYDFGEDALAATMFGLQRADGSLLEICLHSECEITACSELAASHFPWYLRLFARLRIDRVLRSHDEVIDVFRRFYESEAKFFHEEFERL